MPSDAGPPMPDGARQGFPIATLLKALLPTLAATALVVFFFGRSNTRPEEARADGMRRITLSQKDSNFVRISPSAGGATGEVVYAPSGAALHFTLHASGLPGGHRYELEMQVDDAIYTVASYSPDARGALSIDTTLTDFAEGECVGTNFDAPRSIAGRHRIKFWIKRDGSPASGPMPGVAPTAPGAQLACHGNGDGNFEYLLLEDQVAEFAGTSAAAHDSSK
jgi:hypothetical protein